MLIMTLDAKQNDFGTPVLPFLNIADLEIIDQENVKNPFLSFNTANIT